MPSTYSPLLNLTEQATGENAGTWGVILNQQFLELVEDAIARTIPVPFSGPALTLTTTVGVQNQARCAILHLTGSLTSNWTITAPSSSKIYIIVDSTTDTGGPWTISLITAAGGNVPLVITRGTKTQVYGDGTSFYTLGAGSLQGTATGAIDMNAFLFDRPEIKRYRETTANLGNVTGATAIDYNGGNYQLMTLVGNITLSFTNLPASGKAASMTLKLVQDGTGGRTLTMPAGAKQAGGGSPNLTATAGAIDMLFISTDDGGATFEYNINKNYS